MNLTDRSKNPGNTKVRKSIENYRQHFGINQEVRYAALSIAPDPRVCPSSKIAQCADPCLHFSGLARTYSSIIKARVRKLNFWLNDRPAFLKILRHELGLYEKLCLDIGVEGWVRLNVLSDIDWENFDIPQNFPTLNFLDYTKRPDRITGNLPDNYRLIFSYSGAARYQKHVDTAVENNAPIAIVIDKMPTGDFHFLGRSEWIDGDQSDMINCFQTGKNIFLKYKPSKNMTPEKIAASPFILKTQNLIARAA